jgi:hypothetical protein
MSFVITSGNWYSRVRLQKAEDFPPRAFCSALALIHSMLLYLNNRVLAALPNLLTTLLVIFLPSVYSGSYKPKPSFPESQTTSIIVKLSTRSRSSLIIILTSTKALLRLLGQLQLLIFGRKPSVRKKGITMRMTAHAHQLSFWLAACVRFSA